MSAFDWIVYRDAREKPYNIGPWKLYAEGEQFTTLCTLDDVFGEVKRLTFSVCKESRKGVERS